MAEKTEQEMLSFVCKGNKLLEKNVYQMKSGICPWAGSAGDHTWSDVSFSGEFFVSKDATFPMKGSTQLARLQVIIQGLVKWRVLGDRKQSVNFPTRTPESRGQQTQLGAPRLMIGWMRTFHDIGPSPISWIRNSLVKPREQSVHSQSH